VARRPSAARLAALAALALALGACGGSSGGEGTGRGGDVVVSAASSLTEAFTRYGEAFDGGRVRFSFAGSDDLAAQIRQGVEPDVFASANTALPQALHEEGLVGRPVVFATNQLVLAVPRDSDRVTSIRDLATPGVAIAIGSESVPIGAYTREVLGRLDPAVEQAILANVRSNEPDVKGIVGKLAQGAVAAGFVYRTDVQAASGLRGIALAAHLRPQVAYAAAVVTGAPHPARARAFLAGLLHGDARAALTDAGFGPPPPVAGD
jgi:molybdate transport system substrate-binding protein